MNDSDTDPTTRIPNSSVTKISVTKKPGCNISGTESRIIKPLVAKRPGKKSKIRKEKISKKRNDLKKIKKILKKYKNNKKF